MRSPARTSCRTWRSWHRTLSRRRRPIGAASRGAHPAQLSRRAAVALRAAPSIQEPEFPDRDRRVLLRVALLRHGVALSRAARVLADHLLLGGAADRRR